MTKTTQSFDLNVIDQIRLLGQKGKRRASFVIIAGKNVGQFFVLERNELTIGREGNVHILLDDRAVSRLHATLRHAEGNTFIIEDHNSTNGTYVNGERIRSKVLSDGDKVQIGTTVILKFSYHDELELQFQEKLYQSAVRDSLTNCYNKRYFLEQIAIEYQYAIRHGHDLAVIFIDIDYFKAVNDTHSHMAGDMVLKDLCRIMLETARAEDLLARYGGEEFVIIMRESTIEQAYVLAERLRNRVQETTFLFEGVPIKITISMGLASLHGSKTDSADELVRTADEYLYRAKQNGRNRTECILN
jgi:diguanylate cyclase (GGDEF)-like protein